MLQNKNLKMDNFSTTKMLKIIEEYDKFKDSDFKPSLLGILFSF